MYRRNEAPTYVDFKGFYADINDPDEVEPLYATVTRKQKGQCLHETPGPYMMRPDSLPVPPSIRTTPPERYVPNHRTAVDATAVRVMPDSSPSCCGRARAQFPAGNMSTPESRRGAPVYGLMQAGLRASDCVLCCMLQPFRADEAGANAPG